MKPLPKHQPFTADQRQQFIAWHLNLLGYEPQGSEYEHGFRIWLAQQKQARPVGKIVADHPVHGWHMDAFIPWQDIGAGTCLFMSAAGAAMPLGSAGGETSRVTVQGRSSNSPTPAESEPGTPELNQLLLEHATLYAQATTSAEMENAVDAQQRIVSHVKLLVERARSEASVVAKETQERSDRYEFIKQHCHVHLLSGSPTLGGRHRFDIPALDDMADVDAAVDQERAFMAFITSEPDAVANRAATEETSASS